MQGTVTAAMNKYKLSLINAQMMTSAIYFVEESFLAKALSKLVGPAQVNYLAEVASKICTLSNGYDYKILIQTYKY